MALSAQLRPPRQRVAARLCLAYSGVTKFAVTEWARLQAHAWVVDYLHTGQQPQQVGGGRPFARLSHVAALYAPGTRYRERRVAGQTVDESYIVFRLRGDIARAFAALTGRAGYCHIRDPAHRLGDRLRVIADRLNRAQLGHDALAHGAFLELLGLILTATPVAARVRELAADAAPADLVTRTADYIRQHLRDSLRVADLARHAGLSVSVFAHRYPRLAGESPYRTVQRLRVQAAKQLLLQEGLTIKETAHRLGFPSEFQFSRTFKRLEGVAPQRYLTMLRHKSYR